MMFLHMKGSVMHDLAIRELKKDWERHLDRAAKGDVRSVYAAQEILERLAELGCDFFWMECARSRGPAMPLGKEVS
jgi:hypothetical protein